MAKCIGPRKGRTSEKKPGLPVTVVLLHLDNPRNESPPRNSITKDGKYHR